MGMPPDQLGADVVQDMLHGEFSGLLCYGALKDDMKEEIAEFSPEMVEPTPVQRIDHLVGLFDQAVSQGSMGLLAIPGALFAEFSDHPDETAEFGSGNRGERMSHMPLRMGADQHSKLPREAQLKQTTVSERSTRAHFVAVRREVWI